MFTRFVIPGVSDIPTMLKIECQSFDQPWMREDFRRAMCSRFFSGVMLETLETVSGTADVKQQIVGYMFYLTDNVTLDVFNMAIAPQHRRKGYGTVLIDHLKDRLERGRRRRIRALICEHNLPGQLFLKAQGFRCEVIVHGFWGEPWKQWDAYSMEFYKAVVSERRRADAANV